MSYLSATAASSIPANDGEDGVVHLCVKERQNLYYALIESIYRESLLVLRIRYLIANGCIIWMQQVRSSDEKFDKINSCKNYIFQLPSMRQKKRFGIQCLTISRIESGQPHLTLARITKEIGVKDQRYFF